MESQQSPTVRRFFAAKMGPGFKIRGPKVQIISTAKHLDVCDLCHSLNDAFRTMQCESCRIVNLPGMYRKIEIDD